MPVKSKKILVVVDYQNDFVTGTLGFPKAMELEDIICNKIKKCRQEGWEIVYTLDTHYNDYLSTQEGKNLPVMHCVWETDGWRLFGKISELLKEDMFFEKGSFGSIDLMNYLEENEYETVELVGLVSNICVISNAILAKTALPEAEIIVDYACTASNDKDMNEKAMDIMEGLQITVINRN